MALDNTLINKLKELGMTEQQIKQLEIVLESSGMSTRGTDSPGTVAQAQANLEIEKKKFEILKQQHTIQSEMGTRIADQSMLMDRMNDMREERLEYAVKEAEFAQDELDIALNLTDATAEDINNAKLKVIETQKQVKALAQAAKLQEQMNAGADKFAKLMGITGGPLDEMVEGFDVNAVNVKEMGKSMGNFGLKVLSTISPMKVMSTLTSQAVETFMRFDKAQFEIFEQTGIMTAASDMAMMAEETTAFANAGTEMKNTIVGLQQSFSEFQSVSAGSRKELMLTTLAFEGVGVGAGDTGQALATMIQTLGQTPEVAAENAREFSALADQLGRPPAEIIQNFNKMSGALMKHGPAMQGEFMKLQAVAIRTGMSIESLVDVTSTFDTFEDGAQAVGSLNAILGGPYLDTLIMISGTTTERLGELKGALDRTGEDFATMSQARRQAIAKEMGMNVDELAKFMKMSESEMKAAMKEAEVQASKREEMEGKRMKMMDLMSKITVALQEAMEEVFGTEMFDSDSLENVKSVFMSILEVVKIIGKALGGLNTMFSKVTGGKGAASGILTLGAVAGLTIGGKVGLNMLKQKGISALLKKVPGGAGSSIGSALSSALGGADSFNAGVQKVHIVGSDVSLGGGGMGGMRGMGGSGMDMGPDMDGSRRRGRGTGRAGRAQARSPGGQPRARIRSTSMGKGMRGGRFRGAGLRGGSSMMNAARGTGTVARSAGTVARGGMGAAQAAGAVGGGAAKGLGAKLLAGLSVIAGPLMTAIAGYQEVSTAADKERERAMMGGNPNALKVGRMTATAVAHPLANIALQFIPGFGTALSLIDGVLSMFGMSPIKWLIKNLMDILPDAFFPALGKMVIGGEHFQQATPPKFANDALVTSTRFNSSDNTEVVAAKEGGVLAKKLDKLIELLSNQGGKEIVVKVDRKEIARAAISGINNNFYGADAMKISGG